MGNGSQLRIVLACGLIAGVSAICGAQTYTPPPPPLTTLPPCPLGKNGKPDKKHKNCDPTIYPDEKVDTKKSSKDAADVQTAVPGSVSASPQTPAAQQFPFPGEQAAKPADTPAAKAFPYPGSASGSGSGEGPDGTSGGRGISGRSSDVPHDPEAEKKANDTPAGKAFPYPGDTKDGIPGDPDLPAADKQPDTQSSSSGSSSSTDSEGTSDTGNTGDAATAPGPKGEYDDDAKDPPKVKDRRAKKVPPPQTDTQRVDEDLSVAKYYGQSGNKMGAYLRAKDAVKVQPEYAEGHFVLGEAAQRLGKKDEATAEFTEYLKLSPDGEWAKAAEKALDQLR